MYDDTLTVFSNAGQVEVGLQGLCHTINVGKETDPNMPDCFALHSPYPNPFNAQATIRYDIPVTGQVSLTVYDILGREVTQLVNGVVQMGRHNMVWDAGDNPSGIYFCRMDGKGFTQTRKLMLLK
jgi:hypothetical protein